MRRRAMTCELALLAFLFSACNQPEQQNFRFKVEQFADLSILRYQVPGFEKLSLKQKALVYYLSQAALSGRDIIFDQNGKYNLAIRRTLEAAIQSYKGDTTVPEYRHLVVYTKRVWFSNGIYHHYSGDKFVPGFSEQYFRSVINQSDLALLPLSSGQSVDDLLNVICPVMFDPTILPAKVYQRPDKDLVANSASTFYEGVTEKDVERYYRTIKKAGDATPPSYGLNSKLVKENGTISERVWKIGGMYGDAIQRIVFWLEKAATVAENDGQRGVIDALISFYTTGDVRAFDDYSIKWLQDTSSHVDFVNGFIETYNDPLGMRGSWEALVNFKDVGATRRATTIVENAQWFEDNSPVDARFKKKEVKGVSAKVITVAQLGGDCYPSTPIGINLPNADWIRRVYGSKSVTLENITYAYDRATAGSGLLDEFSHSKEDADLVRKYSNVADNLHTDLHECVGHASGQLLPGVSPGALKNYGAPLEEARADLFALYYMMDPRIVELGLLPNEDAAKAAYLVQIRVGLLTQLARIELGKDIEQAHLRNRQLIARWCLEKGKPDNVIELVKKENKVVFRINDFSRLRQLFGDLLKEVQRIKSEGDYEAGKALVETYGVKVDHELHREVLERYATLNISPYSGFINPDIQAVERDGVVVDVVVSYPEDYMQQMLGYSKSYSFLPTWSSTPPPVMTR